MTTTNTTAVLSPRRRQILQNFLLIWLDANFDESKEYYANSVQHIRHVVATIIPFTDVDQCVDFLTDIKDERVFMIVSGALGQCIIPEIQACPQLHSVYVFCDKQSIHEQWATTISKVKGIYTKIESICEALQIDHEQCDRGMLPISFYGIDPLFMYTQLLKETFLEIDDDNRSVKEFVDYCRLQGDITRECINKIEQEYNLHTPIWWYTAPYFIFSMLNRALRLMDVDIILKMGFFIRHLHRHIENLHREQQSSNKTPTTPFQVYRGQTLSIENFEKMKKTKGGFMSFNNFLSTSYNRNLSLELFARPAAIYAPNSVGILFVMTVDPTLCVTSSIPFADVSKDGFFKDQETEILFTTHTIFRIDRIERIHDNHTDRLWQVNLTLSGNDSHDLDALTSHIRDEVSLETGWTRLGEILIRLGEFSKAEHLYQMLFKSSSSNAERVGYYHRLGEVYVRMGQDSEALSSYERSIEIQEKAFPRNLPSLGISYHSIGIMYYQMEEYSKALTSHERSLEIQKMGLPQNHPDIAASYNNIGLTYAKMGEYSKALSAYERSLEIKKIALSPNHPKLASSYNNIGSVYVSMGECSKALSSYERSLEIKKIALPPNHPDLANSYLNIGSLYRIAGDNSKAISYYEKAKEIVLKAVPPHHPFSKIVDIIEAMKNRL